MLGLLLVTAWFYTPTLGFGFIWDDPLWFGRVIGKSLGELVKPMPDFQFYRPALPIRGRFAPWACGYKLSPGENAPRALCGDLAGGK